MKKYNNLHDQIFILQQQPLFDLLKARKIEHDEKYYAINSGDLFQIDYDYNFEIAMKLVNDDFKRATKIYKKMNLYKLYWKYYFKIAINLEGERRND